MKVRLGFVSNSSSTNFIVGKKSYKDVFDLAKDMVGYRFSEGNQSELFKEENQKIMDKIKKAREIGVNPNTTTLIYSANDDIIVGLWENGYIVQGDRQSKYKKKIRDVVKDIDKIDDWKELEIYELWAHFRELFLPEFGILAIKVDTKDDINEYWCSKHHERKLMIIADIYKPDWKERPMELVECPYCYREKNPEPLKK